jgi:hypothetical protein
VSFEREARYFYVRFYYRVLFWSDDLIY